MQRVHFLHGGNDRGSVFSALSQGLTLHDRDCTFPLLKYLSIVLSIHVGSQLIWTNADKQFLFVQMFHGHTLLFQPDQGCRRKAQQHEALLDVAALSMGEAKLLHIAGEQPRAPFVGTSECTFKVEINAPYLVRFALSLALQDIFQIGHNFFCLAPFAHPSLGGCSSHPPAGGAATSKAAAGKRMGLFFGVLRSFLDENDYSGHTGRTESP